MARAIPALLLPLALAGCGLHPLYAGGANGPVARALAEVEVAPIAGKAGWLMRGALIDDLGGQPKAPRYRLVVHLDDAIEATNIRSDQSVTRERRTLRARYQLVDLSSGQPVLDASAGSDVGVDVVSSEYATIAAENTGLERLAKVVADQVVARIAMRTQAPG